MRPIVIAHVSDLHCGSTVALCPPHIELDDGGLYTASKAQNWLWENLNDYWQKVHAARKNLSAELYLVFNGDLVEGNHHGTTQILSGNPNAQAAALTAAMAIPLALQPDRLFFIRGTEAHVGSSASSEERIADGLRRDKRPVIKDPDTGTSSWWHCRIKLGTTRLDIAHHGRTGGREHTRAGAASLHAHDILLSHVKAGDEPPTLCLRGHHHRFNDSHDACSVRVVTSGAWQLKTAYVHKIAADTLADIGGLIIVVDDAGYTVEKVHYKSHRGTTWTPNTPTLRGAK